jgi:predicted DNA-binding protein
MNDWDRDNLNFLMSCPQVTLSRMAKEMDIEDLNYAINLLRIGRSELMIQEMEQCLDYVEDLTVAKNLLNKIKG